MSSTVLKLAVAAAFIIIFFTNGASVFKKEEVIQPEQQNNQAQASIAVASAQVIAPKAAPLPTRITIPAIKVNAPVIGLGLTADKKKMAVPNNFSQVSWYDLGTRPGDIGSAVMGAHVDNGAKIPGVFKNLKNLKPGDSIYITYNDGASLRFIVKKRIVYNYQTPAKDSEQVFALADKPRLNLITCYGTWLPKQNTYDRRLVVSAELYVKR